MSEDDTLQAERRLAAFAGLFRTDSAIPEEPVHTIEGEPEQGQLSLKVLMTTDDFVVLKAWRARGLVDPPHKHDDHESVATLISGRMRMRIGERTFEVGPGDVWRHPRGIVHGSVALEDCVQIEIKSPPRRTWNL